MQNFMKKKNEEMLDLWIIICIGAVELLTNVSAILKLSAPSAYLLNRSRIEPIEPSNKTYIT